MSPVLMLSTGTLYNNEFRINPEKDKKYSKCIVDLYQVLRKYILGEFVIPNFKSQSLVKISEILIPFVLNIS